MDEDKIDTEEQEEIETQQGPFLTVRAEGTFNIEHVIATAADQAVTRALKTLEAKVTAAIEEGIGGGFSDAVKARVQSAVDEVLDKGFPQYDQYGRKTGIKPLAERVVELLARKDRYDSRDPFERMVTEQFGRKLDQALDPLVKRARESFSAQVDETCKGALAGALRSALGLSR